MADYGLNDNLKAGSREFHVQTATLVDEGVVRTEVFEKGRLLFVGNLHYERRLDLEERGAGIRLRQSVDQFHQSIIEEIDTLFEISDRVDDENSPGAHEKIGQVFLYMHIFDKAEYHLMKCIELDPTRYSSYIYLGRVYLQQKRYDQALEWLEKVRKRDVEFPDLFNLMGLIMLEKRQSGRALGFFKEALKRNQNYIEAYFNIAEALLRRIMVLLSDNRVPETRKNFEFLKLILKKINTLGNTEERKQSVLIGKALQKSDLQKALGLLNEFREGTFNYRIPPEIIGFKFYLRLIYTDEGITGDLLTSYEEKITAALNYNPSYPDLWHYLGLIHLMQCRHFFLTGLENFRDATRINPHFDKAVKNLRLVENDGREFLSLIKTIV